MKISFLGDSITEGYQASSVDRCYVSRVGQILHCEVRNYGIGGTRIAKQQSLTYPHTFDMFFASRTDFIDTDSDLVFVFGGVNDYIHGDAPIGNIQDHSMDTFCGGLNGLLDILIGKFGADKIKFIIPPRIYHDDQANIHHKTLSDYVALIREILQAKKIDYIDLYLYGYPKPRTDTADEFTADGVHPNDAGYDLIANMIADFIKNKNLYHPQ